MLLNINFLLKKKIFLNKKNKYNINSRYIIYRYKDILVLNLIFILKYLYLTYNYMYIINKYKKKLLFVNNYKFTCNFIQYFSNITNNFYISTFNHSFFTNWKETKSKLIILKWLLNLFKYHFNIGDNLELKKLFLLYIKLLHNYIGIYNLKFIPSNLFYINYSKTIFIKNKIILSLFNVNENTDKFNKLIIPCNNKNLHSIKYIFLILGSVYK